MTEDEAKTKWCPFARFYDAEVNKTYNRTLRYAIDDLTPRCIGSECMAWRITFDYGPIVTIDDKMYQELYQTTPTGYCGLAGKP